MTKLSVNINKIALIRNSRGRDYPSVLDFSKRCLDLGAHGLTLHPRPDQRHARYSDVPALKELCQSYDTELNVEGYPTDDFLRVVLDAKPAQCTLVPDAPGQITSDHGWDVENNIDLLRDVISKLKDAGIRSSLFMDHGTPELARVKEIGADRIELYTEPYAEAFVEKGENQDVIFTSFEATAREAEALGLGVNAGHDLNLQNLEGFLRIPNILEVSIGHALIVECIEHGVDYVLTRYLDIVATTKS